MARDASVAGVVLAGGLSRRMGGDDKALADLCGRPMIEHVVTRLRPQVSALAVNANGDATRFAALGLPVLPDPVAGFVGPLAGLLAGLQWARRSAMSHLVTVPADTPFVPADLVARLGEGIKKAEIAVAASRDGTDHPTVALWSVALADDLVAWLEQGKDRAVRAWIGARRAVTVAFPGDGADDPFFNVNTPADLARAVERLRRPEA